MSSKKLRKYLAYYRKTLRDDPENIEARLRLAALFREMGRERHAIEEYGTAAKLLASEGLPLEAIAACKAILELDATHQETQFFLARLYAQVPEATGDSVRVAKPLEPPPQRRGQDSEQGSSPKAGGEVASKGRSEQKSTSTQWPAAGESESSGRDKPVRSMRPTTSVAEQAPAASSAELRSGDGGRPLNGRGERTKVQTPIDQRALRDQSIPENDRETIELGVFDMDSLGLDESSADWDDLKMPEDVEEPQTQEFELSEKPASSNGVRCERREFRVSTLPRIPLFSQLPREVFVEVLDAMELERVDAGTEILEPGDPASRLYVVVDGQVRVEKDRIDGRTIELATMGEGEIFGEFRLLTGKGGWARVVAKTDVELLMVSDEVIYRLGRRYPELWDALWSFYYDRMLNNAMASSRIFGTLNVEERQLLVPHFELTELPAESVLFSKGQVVDEMSLVVIGSVRVEVPDGRGGWKLVDTLDEGAFLGVSPCAEEMPAPATVTARTDVVLYQMQGSIFRELMYGLPEVEEAVRDVVRARLARTTRLQRLGDTASVSDLV